MDPLHLQKKSQSYEDLQRLIAWMDSKDESTNTYQETQQLQPAESSSQVQQLDALPKYPAATKQSESNIMYHEYDGENTSQLVEPENVKSTDKSWHELMNSQVEDLNALRDVLAQVGYSTTAHVYPYTVLCRIRSLNASVQSLIESARIAQNLQHPVMQTAEHPELISYKILQILRQVFTRGGLNYFLNDQLRIANGDAEKIVQVIIEDTKHRSSSKKRNHASLKKPTDNL